MHCSGCGQKVLYAWTKPSELMENSSILPLSLQSNQVSHAIILSNNKLYSLDRVKALIPIINELRAL